MIDQLQSLRPGDGAPTEPRVVRIDSESTTTPLDAISSETAREILSHLHEDTGDGLRQVGRSRSYPRGSVGINRVLVERVRTNDFLSQPVANGSYHVRVSGPADATHHIELVSTTHRFETAVPRRSIAAPATARREGVVAVGAGELSGRGVEPRDGDARWRARTARRGRRPRLCEERHDSGR